MKFISLMYVKNICSSRLRIYALAGLIPLLTACGWIQPHKLDIEQGNAITLEEFESLYTGMSQAEVITAVGAPILKDSFHANRWDYMYRFTPGKGRQRESRFTLYFRDGILVKIDGENYKEY